MTIIQIDGRKAIAESSGVQAVVDISLTPDVKISDKVIVHAGFIIEKLDPKQAQEIEEVWNLYMDSLKDEKKLPG